MLISAPIAYLSLGIIPGIYILSGQTKTESGMEVMYPNMALYWDWPFISPFLVWVALVVACVLIFGNKHKINVGSVFVVSVFSALASIFIVAIVWAMVFSTYPGGDFMLQFEGFLIPHFYFFGSFWTTGFIPIFVWLIFRSWILKWQVSSTAQTTEIQMRYGES